MNRLLPFDYNKYRNEGCKVVTAENIPVTQLQKFIVEGRTYYIGVIDGIMINQWDEGGEDIFYKSGYGDDRNNLKISPDSYTIWVLYNPDTGRGHAFNSESAATSYKKYEPGSILKEVKLKVD